MLIFRPCSLLFLLLPFLQNAQSLDSLIASFNRNLEAFDTFNPHYGPVHIDSTAMPMADKKAFLAEYEVEPNEVEPIELQSFYLVRLDSIVRLLFAEPDLLKRDLAKHLKCGVIQTEDRRFLQLSFHENTGGTYQSRVVHYLYRSADSSYSSIYMNDDKEINLDADGYLDVDYLGSRSDTNYYFFQGGVRGCSYCFASTAGIFIATANGLSEFQTIEVNSRYWGTTIEIDKKDDGSREIAVHHQVDDLSGPCYCDRAREGEEDNFDQEQGAAIYCKYLYRYYNYRIYLLESSCLYQDPLDPEGLRFED